MPVKYRTFTVLFVEEYDSDNGVVMSDEEARNELRDNLQAVYDDTPYGPGTNFLIVDQEDGNSHFWKKWREAMSGRITPTPS